MATIAHVRGTIVGAAILTLFGAVWCFLALASWTTRPPWAIPAASIAAIALLASAALRLYALRNIPSIDDPIAAEKGKRDGMYFGLIFTAEGAFIGLASVLLAHAHLDTWISPVAAAIVGLHFLPLARLFKVPLYYWTGALIVVGMAACALIHDPESRQRSAAFITAAILWLTAAVILARSRASIR